MDQPQTEAAEADRLAQRRLDEIAELFARAILRVLASEAATAPSPAAGTKGRTEKAAPLPTPDGKQAR